MDEPEDIEVSYVESVDDPAGPDDGARPAPPWVKRRPRQPELKPDAAPRRPDNFRIGEVFSLTFSLLAKSPLLYLTLSLFACLPGILIQLFSNQPPTPQDDAGPWHFFNIKLAVDIFLSVIFLGAITYGVYRNLLGQRAGLWDAVARGLSRYFALVGMSLIFIIGIVLLFAVAALIGMFGIIGVAAILAALVLLAHALCTYCIITPACVVEGLGPMDSFGRSAELTRGHRWGIFGLFLAVYICLGLIGYVLGVVFTAKYMGVNIAENIFNILSTAYLEVAVATLYYQLRIAKEGVGIDELAQVFD